VQTKKLKEAEGQWVKLQEGNLVLLRPFEIDKHKGRKLEVCWEGPYHLSDISWYGRTEGYQY